MNSGIITLRPFRVSDVDDFLVWAGDDEVTRNLRWKTITSKEEALTFIREVCIPHPWRRSICIDDRSIGFVSVFRWSGDDRAKADIGYAIAAKYWGQGIATTAVKMAVAEVFEELPELVRLQAFTAVENKASQKVLEKAGFTKEGLLRKYTFFKGQLMDLVLYSLLSTDTPISQNQRSSVRTRSIFNIARFISFRQSPSEEMNSGILTLRPFRVSDVDDFMVWAGDDEVTRTLRWKTITSKEEALTFIKEVCIPNPWCRSICIDDRSIGFVSVFRWSADNPAKADIGYATAAEYWGQGIATKAVKMAVTEVFEELPGLVRLQAFTSVENKASQRVLQKAGFTKEGLLRQYAFIKGELMDSVIFSLLSTDIPIHNISDSETRDKGKAEYSRDKPKAWRRQLH